MYVFSEEDKEKIKSLVKYAEEHPVHIDRLLDCHNGDEPPIGDNPMFSVSLSYGIRAVFSIDNYVEYKIKHISISENHVVPSIPVAMFVIEAFGFKNHIHDCSMYLETGAINILEKNE